MRKTTHKSLAPWVTGAVLTVITIAVFIQVCAFDLLIYDDYAYVIANPQVKTGLSLKNFVWAFTATDAHNWHPLTWLSLMFDYELFGLYTGGFHLTSLLLHTANTVLLFILLLKMTKALWSSAFVAAAFALHPLHVQSVAWVAERKDVLSSLFWLLTMLFYVRYTERSSIRRYLFAIFAFTLGLMAKPMLVTLPFILLLLDYWPLKRKRSLPKLLFEKLPFVFLAGVSSVITFVIQLQSGAVKDIVKFPFDIRVINALVSYVKYILKMFWPVNLSVFYPHPGRSLHYSDAIVPTLLLVAVTVLAIRFARAHGYLLFGWLWYVITLIPVIGLVQVGNQAMADRYTYIPLIGLFIIIAWGLPELLARYAFRKTILAIAAAVVLLAMTVSTCVQLRYWRNSVTIFERAVEVSPNNCFVHTNLGVAFMQKNAYDDAIANFEKALQIDPCDAKTHINIGVAYFRRDKKVDLAIGHFEKAAAIDPCDVPTRLNLATALAKQGKTQQAIEQCDEILRMAPGRTEAIELKQQILQQRQQQ
jgi:tetratricopeptide (TPR) repeat protein